FAPWLMPLRQISGLRRSTLSTASFTQSTGVPEHCQASTPSNRSTGCRRRGRPMVMACPMPDCGLSGATTTTFPRSLTASTRLRIPGAITPSSLVIRITGRSFFIVLGIMNSGERKYYFFPPARSSTGGKVYFFHSLLAFCSAYATFAAGLKSPKMAGQLKEVRNRIKSIQSTQQITKAMKMISATKLRKAQEAIQQMRPSSKKLQQVLGNIVSDSDGAGSSALSTPRPVEKALLILITSDRSSCGAYNSNLIKLAKATMREKYPAQAAKGNVMIWSIGKKGFEHFLKNNYPVNGEFRDIFQN